jgi:hypothetical protein
LIPPIGVRVAEGEPMFHMEQKKTPAINRGFPESPLSALGARTPKRKPEGQNQAFGSEDCKLHIEISQ